MADNDLNASELTGERREPEKHRPYFGERGRFLHENLARDLIDLRSACLIDSMPAIWDDLESRYRIGFSEWEKAMIDRVYCTSTHQRREVVNYLMLIAPQYSQGDPHLIACANGVVNPWEEGFGALREDGTYVGHYRNDPELHIPNVIGTSWNPSAYDPDTDEALDAFSCNDPDVRENLEEVAAACIYRGSEIQQMAVAVGTGGNGKSVYMRMLERMLGPENVSTVDLRDIGRRFLQAPIMGKLANIADDVSSGNIDATPLAVVKKITTGDPITIEEKCKPAVTVRPYAKLVFAANQFPRLGDHSTGMIDRIFGIRFAADFRHRPDIRVTNMSAVLDTELSRQYLLNLALRRLPELVARGGYSPTEYSESMRVGILLENDSVAFWLDSEGVTRRHIDGEEVSVAYQKYRTFCEAAGRMPVEQRAFTVRVNRQLGTRTEKDSWNGSRQVRAFRA